MLADGMPKSEKLLTPSSLSPVTDDPAHYSLLQLQAASNIPKCISARLANTFVHGPSTFRGLCADMGRITP